jgi:hypothetical protein
MEDEVFEEPNVNCCVIARLLLLYRISVFDEGEKWGEKKEGRKKRAVRREKRNQKEMLFSFHKANVTFVVVVW